jgi:TPR repeat protein
MKKALLPLTLFTALTSATISHATVNDGIQAYHRGDYKIAIENFEAAQDSDPAAKHYLASLYLQGKGVAKDDAKARTLYTEAADSGYLPSITNLGVIYMDEKNYVKAREYFEKAAAQNDLRSIYNLGNIHLKALGTSRDLEKAATYFKLAAEAGYKPAQNEYGMLLAQGQGVSLDFVEAYAWINLAAEAGDSTAMANLDRLSNVLKGEKKEAAIARAEALKAQFAK